MSARASVGSSPMPQAMPPPMFWSSSGVAPHVRPIAPYQSASSSPLPVMIVTPKNACEAIVAKSVTMRSGYGNRYGTGSTPIIDRLKR